MQNKRITELRAERQRLAESYPVGHNRARRRDERIAALDAEISRLEEEGSHAEYSTGLSPRVLLHSVDTDSLQGRSYAPLESEEGTQGTVLGITQVVQGLRQFVLFGVLLDTGRFVEAASWEITEDDEYPSGLLPMLDCNKTFAEGIANPTIPETPGTYGDGLGADPAPLPRLSDAEQVEGEAYPGYLRRVGGDYRESGKDATAEDYEESAERLERTYRTLAALAERSDVPAAVAAELRRAAVEAVQR